MAIDDTRSVKLFYSYAHKDKGLRDRLAIHLGKRYISWHDRDIYAGMNWEHAIDTHLNSADVILLLISADFMDSDYCNGVEMKRALERQANGEAEVIPIILRPVHWKNPPFSHLQFLPITDKGEVKAVTRWDDLDEAFVHIAKGVGEVADMLLKKRENIEAKKRYMSSAEEYAASNDYGAALSMIHRALLLFPEDASLYKSEGITLLTLGQSEQNILTKKGHFKAAAEAFEKAIKFSSGRDAELFRWQGDTLLEFALYDSLSMRTLYQEALNAYSKAIELDPENAAFYAKKGSAFNALQRYPEAIDAYRMAINFDSRNAELWRNMAASFDMAGRFSEAHEAYQEAIEHNPHNAFFHKEKGDMLFKMNDLLGALAAYTDAINLNKKFRFAYFSRSEVYKKLAEEDIERAKQLDEHEENP